jgi:uncharacterized protein
MNPFAINSEAHFASRDDRLFPHFRAQPISYLHVRMEDGFWVPRQKATRETTVPWVTHAHDRSGGVEAFRRLRGDYVAKTTLGEVEHVKFIEAMASVLGVQYDDDIAGLVDAWSSQLVRAQSDDGYLGERFPPSFVRLARRWEPIWWSHEDYFVGHYIEAAIGYQEATGSQVLLDSARRAADNMAEELLGGDRPYAPGHAEIEQALMRLYGVTGEETYLRLCGWLIDQRGRHEGRPSFGRYGQDHLPVREQRTIEGHAVRAAFLFNGVTEYVGATGDRGLREAVLAVWDDMVDHKMWLHGASGNLSATNEGYRSDPCHIRPDDCYGESCAAYANFRWAHSLFALTAEARYLNVAERILYNAFAASLSLDGDRTFYTNVAQTGLPATAQGALLVRSDEPRQTMRSPELAASCCPPNIVKLINTIGGFFYSIDEAGIYVKHYGANEADLPWGAGLKLTQRTNYPWDETISLLVEAARPETFALRLRVPEWAKDHRLSIDGRPLNLAPHDGWLTVAREWQSNEVVLTLVMETERITMPPHFSGYENRAALQRGPIVYCLEEQDLEHSGSETESGPLLASLYIPPDYKFDATYECEFLGGVTVLRGPLVKVGFSDTGKPVRAMFIPYGVWGNRKPSEMRIWLGAHDAPPLDFLFQQMGIDPDRL